MEFAILPEALHENDYVHNNVAEEPHTHSYRCSVCHGEWHNKNGFSVHMDKDQSGCNISKVEQQDQFSVRIRFAEVYTEYFIAKLLNGTHVNADNTRSLFQLQQL